MDYCDDSASSLSRSYTDYSEKACLFKVVLAFSRCGMDFYIHLCLHDRGKIMEETHETMHGTWKSYILGFVLSVLLTLMTYIVVVKRLFPHNIVLITIAALAIAQGVVQLVLFLHLGDEDKPRSKLFMFLLMILILAIILLGTLWIMFDLDVRTMYMNMGK